MTKWNEYSEHSSSEVMADADTFLVRNVSDTDQSAAGSVNELPFSTFRENVTKSVKSYGAVGDGTQSGGGTDDTAAIQAAITAAEADGGGGVVYLPPGQYRITSTLTITGNGLQFIGAGTDSGETSPNGTTIFVDADVIGISLVTAPALFRLANFRMSPTDTNTTNPAIQVAASSSLWTIENVYIHNSYNSGTKKYFATGIYVIGAVSGTLRNVIANRVLTTGIKLGNGTSAFNSGHLDHCYTVTETGATTRGYLLNKVNSTTFTSCVAEGWSKKGVEMIECTHNTLITPHLECDSENGQTCLEMNASSQHNVVVSGRYTVKDATGTPIVLDTATNNLFLHPHITVGTVRITVKGASTWNVFLGGDIDLSEIDETAVGSTQNTYLFPEGNQYFWNTESTDTQWRIGDDQSGLETQLGDTAALLAARTNPGFSVTASGGSDPFDNTGNLIIKPRSTAGRDIYFYTGSTPTKRAKIGDSLIEFEVAAQNRYLPIVTHTATGSITAAAHAGAINLLGEVGGNALVTLTLPEATGSGAVYKFVVSVVNTSNYVIKTADAANCGFYGTLNILDVDSNAQTAYAGVATDDIITLNGTTTGGQLGDWVELTDFATDMWSVRGNLVCPAGSDVADPFSST